MPIPSPFHSRTKALNQTQEWQDWAGYFAAVSYQINHEIEYFAIRDSAALIDVSPLYKYEIDGPDGARLANRIMTRDIRKCKVGQAMYGPWCDENGHVIDDGTIARLGKNHFRITAADPNLLWFQDVAYGMRAKVRDASEELAALALQGPNSRKILNQLFGNEELNKLPYYHLNKMQLEGHTITISRTGYTGDLGYELWIDRDKAELLWDRLMDIGEGYGIYPVGLASLDMARVEAGLLLIGVDYTSSRSALIPSQKSSPYELGMAWAVKLNQENFIGQAVLQLEKKHGSKRRLVGLDIAWQDLEVLFDKVDLPPQVAGRASRLSIPIYKMGKHIGQATSMVFSPILKKYIALATVETAAGKIGDDVEIEITVEYERKKAKARIVKIPFFNPKRKKSIIDG